MASDDAVREQAIGPGRDTSEVPRRQHHLDHPAGRCQRRVRRRRPDHQDVVGPHRRRQRVIIIHRERDVPAQAHVAVVLPSRRQEVRVGRIVVHRILRPIAVIPLVGVHKQRRRPRHIRVLQPAHDVSLFRTAMRRDTAHINPVGGVRCLEEAHGIIPAHLQHIVGGDDIWYASRNQSIGHLTQRGVRIGTIFHLPVQDQDGLPVVEIGSWQPVPLLPWRGIAIALHRHHIVAQVNGTAGPVVDFHILVPPAAFAELAEEQIGGAGHALHEEGVGALSADGRHPYAGGIDPQRHEVGIHPLRHHVGKIAVLDGGAGVGGVQQQIQRRVIQPVRAGNIGDDVKRGVGHARAMVQRVADGPALADFGQLTVRNIVRPVDDLAGAEVHRLRIVEVKHFIPRAAHAHFVEVHVIQRVGVVCRHPRRQPDAGDGADVEGGVAERRNRRRIGILLRDGSGVALIERPHPDRLDGRVPFAHNHIVAEVFPFQGIVRAVRGVFARPRHIDARPLVVTMKLAEEDFLLVSLRPAHQGQAHILVVQLVIVATDLVVHHKSDECPPAALDRQLAGHLDIGRHLRIRHPLQLVGVGVWIHRNPV